jgi:urease accessory protein
MKMAQTRWLFLLAVIALLPASAAEAHWDGSVHAGLYHGLLHPLTGADHLIALLVIGAWAGLGGGRTSWLTPLTFIAAMAVGSGLAFAGIGVAGTESVIASSVLVSGLLVALVIRMPTLVGMTLMGLFGVFHGHAHALEMHAAAGILPYLAGLILGSALLLAAGSLIAGRLSAAGRIASLRLIGCAAAATGAMFLSAA